MSNFVVATVNMKGNRNRAIQSDVRTDGIMITWVMEVLALALATFAPWAMFCMPPGFQAMFYAGIFVLLSLWGVRMLLSGKVVWQWCPLVICFGCLVLLGCTQLISFSFLSSISPSTAAVYERFLPKVVEVLPFGIPRVVPATPVGTTLSLYPLVTQVWLLRALSVFLVFALVRSNFPAESFLLRLSFVALANGALLSMFGLLQYYSSPSDVIYWSIKVGGTFFITAGRNHTPFFLNICIGLGVGLFLWRSYSNRHGESYVEYLQSLFQDSARLWILFALILLTVAVIVSQSRTAFVALVGGAAVGCGLYVVGLGFKLRYVATPLAIFVLLWSILSWLRFDWMKSRVITTLLKSNLADDGRVATWKKALSVFQEFPIWGSGGGTFGFLERLRNTAAGDNGVFLGHAYNEFLEAGAEGGIVRLLLTLLIAALLFRSGYRSFRRNSRSPVGGLLLGALIALATMVIHACFDPALHLNANAYLATLVAAGVAGIGSATVQKRQGLSNGAESTAKSRLVPLVFAMSASLFLAGGFLFLKAVGAVQTHRAIQSAASCVVTDDPLRTDRALEIQHLENAVSLLPGNAWLRLELAEAYLNWFQEQRQALMKREQTQIAADLITGFAAHPSLATLIDLSNLESIRHHFITDGENRLIRDFLGLALQQYLAARDLCPLLAPAHARLATYFQYLEKKDARDLYFSRAKQLLPVDPEFWYYCGIEEINEGQLSTGCQSWRHALELSDTLLPLIISRSRDLFSPDQILTTILPDNPTLIYRADRELFRGTSIDREESAYLEKIVNLLSKKPYLSRTANECYLEAFAFGKLGQLENAIEAYAKALSLNPSQIDWRLEYAAVLNDRGLVQQARKQWSTVLTYQPNHLEAKRKLRLSSD